MNRYLLVRSNGKPFGLPVDHVIEVFDDAPSMPVPGFGRAVRGLTERREKLMTMIHLAELLTGEAGTPSVRATAVVVSWDGRRVAIEVDDADAVVRVAAMELPRGSGLPWASGIADVNGEHVPLIDMAALATRLARIEEWAEA